MMSTFARGSTLTPRRREKTLLITGRARGHGRGVETLKRSFTHRSALKRLEHFQYTMMLPQIRSNG